MNSEKIAIMVKRPKPKAKKVTKMVVNEKAKETVLFFEDGSMEVVNQDVRDLITVVNNKIPF